MSQSTTSSGARERVLDAAAKLFAERGYAAVTLRDIAAAVGIQHTSLYHHVPGGKEALFIEVTERQLQQHRQGLTAAIGESEVNIRSQLFAAADWFLSQPPMDLVRMTYADMPAIAPKAAKRLADLALEALITPIKDALVAAQKRGEIAHKDLGVIAGGLVGLIESLHAVPDYTVYAPTTPHPSRAEMARTLIDVMVRGLACPENRPNVGRTMLG